MYAYSNKKVKKNQSVFNDTTCNRFVYIPDILLLIVFCLGTLLILY